MGAPPRVSEHRIREVLEEWRWNISASADELGISRSAVRKRIRLLGIERPPAQVEPSCRVEPSPAMATNAPGGLHGSRTSTGNYREPAPLPIFSGMVTQSVAAEAAAPSRRAKPVVVRLRPDQIEQLRDGKFDYQARHREEVEETDLLRRFFDDGFKAWLKRSLE